MTSTVPGGEKSSAGKSGYLIGRNSVIKGSDWGGGGGIKGGMILWGCCGRECKCKDTYPSRGDCCHKDSGKGWMISRCRHSQR